MDPRVRPLGEGTDHVAYEINGDVVVRVSRRPAPAGPEARLLSLVADVSPLPTPRVIFADDHLLAYRRLPGVPLLDLPRGDELPVARRLGTLLRALHAIPAARVSALVPADEDPPSTWLAGLTPVPAAAAFLAAPPPPPAANLVFSHNDLGIEHVLVDPDSHEITGIIDWSDAALVDPACDFGRILRDLGPAALDAAAESYGGEVSRPRALFYARCGALEDLAYGLETGKATYADKATASLGWLFPG
ncbi:phosphotransferase family protein [Catenuloplanes japonicus]|uniref:phosphotransferase family protein n=1 Tax=Catenuloplanes japonicus TaxID=33876 RepID=UPI001E5DCF77|nr:aminoglycoside 3'-phosphotransferase/choline kinase family protein [Catenuloplanes japonicus]